MIRALDQGQLNMQTHGQRWHAGKEGGLQTSQHPRYCPGSSHSAFIGNSTWNCHLAAPEAVQCMQLAAPGGCVWSLSQICSLSSWYLNDHPPADNPGGDQCLLIGAGFQPTQLGCELLQVGGRCYCS